MDNLGLIYIRKVFSLLCT